MLLLIYQRKPKSLLLVTIMLYILVFFQYSVLAINTSLYSVKLNKYSAEVYNEKTSRYMLSSSSPIFQLPNTPFQRIIKWDKKSILLISGKLNTNEVSTVLPMYLTNTRFLNINSPEIVELSRKFRNSKEVIRDVEGFVCNHIKRKIFGIPLLPALQILESRSGDCTEHTILTIAILRSLKIPCRAIIGMILCKDFQGHKNVFVYHMWAEAYKDGDWLLIDSTRPGKKFHNRYISFSYHHLKTEMPLSCLKAVSGIKNLSVEYINRSIEKQQNMDFY
ncbi:MAG: transglutaminase-like domain-containing protein [Spirochaetota bacterium]|nr:transglutaminase-like domain-containing protein [Spirochaetota bacterium]